MPEVKSDPDALMLSRRLVYFAAERTLMAWIRTALGLMALGFVIDRFGLVLRQLTGQAAYPNTFSFWAGTLLVVIGALMAGVAAVRYGHFALMYRREQTTRPGHGLLLGVLFTVLVAAAGTVIAAFLVTVAR